MLMLEISEENGLMEVWHFVTTDKALDYIYMIEGESLLPEYRSEYQRRAPGTSDINAIKDAKGQHFFCWVVAGITYSLTYVKSEMFIRHHAKFNAHPVSKFWGTVHGLDTNSFQQRESAAKRINHPTFTKRTGNIEY